MLISHPSRPTSLLTARRGGTGAHSLALPSRAQVDLLDHGLTGAPGALAVINAIRARGKVTKLILGHNALGDAGCVALFAFLRSPEGRARDAIAEVSLNSNGIGEAGLLAIAAWLEGNEHAREVFLQDNALRLSPTSVAALSHALNTSRLRVLSLASNALLSDAFLAAFLPPLHAPHLRVLHLSATGLTPAAAAPLAAFVRARARCRLAALRVNGNVLGVRGVRALVRALARNWRLRAVEMYANQLNAPVSGADDDDDDEGPAGDDGVDGRPDPGGCLPLVTPLRTWQECEAALAHLALLKAHMNKETARDALALLRHARPALLRSWWQDSARDGAGEGAVGDEAGADADAGAAAVPRRRLPPELALAVLAWLAPALSAAQSIRVCDYAQRRDTLPGITLQLPALHGSSALWSPTPAGLEQDRARLRTGSTLETQDAADEARSVWLESVECDAYDP